MRQGANGDGDGDGEGEMEIELWVARAERWVSEEEEEVDR